MPKSIRSRRFAQAGLSAALAMLAAPAFAQSLSLLDARVVEDTGGQSMLLFEARLSAPTTGNVSFDFTTSDGTATAGSDYTQLPLVGLLSIPAGQTSLMISVPVIGDASIEPNEYLAATLSNVAGASLGRATVRGLIVNDDNKMLASAPHDPLDQQGGSGGSASGASALSADGRFVAFVSNALDLVAVRPGTVVKRIYVRDTRTGVTTVASVATDGGDSNGDSNNPVLSANGRYVVFDSMASNLVPGDANQSADVFRRDLLAGTTELVSVNSAGTAPGSGGFSTRPSISADGRKVAFHSLASNLVAGDVNGTVDAFVRDMQSGTTVQANPQEFQGAFAPHISADGRYVLYDRGGSTAPWRRDLLTGEQLSMATGMGGMIPNGTTYNYGLSADGRYALFLSWADNLNWDGGASPAVYRSDAQTGQIVLVSRGSNGFVPGSSATPAMSDDGRYVVFTTVSTAAGEPVDDNTRDVYLRDLQANTTIRLSENYLGGIHSGGDNENPSISADGRVVAFLSYSPTMLPDDNNARPDVFRVVLPQDAALPSITLHDGWMQEDNRVKTLYFDVSLSAPATAPVKFDFTTADGTAVSGPDYGGFNLSGQTIPVGQQTATFAIEINGDQVPEADEAFNVYLGNVSGARLLDGHALVIIGNDDAAPTGFLTIGDVSIAEGNSGIQVATFTVTLSAPSATPVRFDYATADGTAIAGSDYMPNAATGLTIPAGSTSATFNVGINGDALVEANETFVVNLSNAIGATIADSQGVATITNDDAYPTLTIGDVSISEGNNGTQLATFTVQLSSAAASPVGFDIATADGTAAAGSDYVSRSLTAQVIPAGASSASFAVTVSGDGVVEADETFQVNVGNVSGAIVVDGSAVGTLLNDDVPPSLSVADVTVAEGNSGTRVATFTLQLSAAAASPVSFSYATANGTAVAPGDFVASSGSGQIPVGASGTTINVTINGDTAIEPTENFQFNLSGVGNAIVVDGQAIGTIGNDDFLPTLSIADVSITEGNNGSKLATFTVTLSAASSSAVGFTAATANGTAVAPGDYTAMAATTLAISAGQLSKSFTVSIKGDKTVEPNEVFYVNLSNPANATIADGQAVGTIVNDDSSKFTVSRVTTGGLYDDVDDRKGDVVVSPRDYALLLLDSAKQVCARAGGASIVGVDGVENLSVLADLADTANGLCAGQPRYRAALKSDGLGFLVARGTQVLDVTSRAKANATELTVLPEGRERTLTVMLAATPSTNARERAVQLAELDRLVGARLSADGRARIVVLGTTGLSGLVDLTARSLPAGGVASEHVWVSPAVLEEFDGLRLDLPGAPKPKPAEQVLQLP